jgi:Pyridine nucleotide-disulphide oxidoreductase
LNRVTSTDVAVVGAGPYGLAVAAHLGALNVPHRIFGRAMDAWLHNMPEKMVLKSEGLASSISSPGDAFSLERFCRETGRPYKPYGQPISNETFSEYGLAFRRTLVPNLEEINVVSLTAQADTFLLLLATGETVSAKQVVIATGFVAHRYMPKELRALPDQVATHTSDHRNFEGFAGKTVAVVGAGQSALETAALLRESGARVCVLVRKPMVAWNPDPEPWPRPFLTRLRAPIGGLGAGWKTWIFAELPGVVRRMPYDRRVAIGWGELGPAGGWWLKKRVEGLVDVLLNHEVVGASVAGSAVELEVKTPTRPKKIVADHVIAGTGYHFSLDSIEFLDTDLRDRISSVDGAPTLSRRFESSLPGLYFAGIAATPTFGPVMRFVYGTRFAATRIAAGILSGSSRETSRVGHDPLDEAAAPDSSTMPAASSER